MFVLLTLFQNIPVLIDDFQGHIISSGTKFTGHTNLRAPLILYIDASPESYCLGIYLNNKIQPIVSNNILYHVNLMD